MDSHLIDEVRVAELSIHRRGEADDAVAAAPEPQDLLQDNPLSPAAVDESAVEHRNVRSLLAHANSSSFC